MDGAKEKEKPVKSWFHFELPPPCAGIFLSSGERTILIRLGSIDGSIGESYQSDVDRMVMPQRR